MEWKWAEMEMVRIEKKWKETETAAKVRFTVAQIRFVT